MPISEKRFTIKRRNLTLLRRCEIVQKILMSIRILHTADNHIGTSFAQYPEDVRERLLEERFTGLGRIVATANTRKAHFLVVGGDLFDKQTVTKKMVERAAEILAKFDGEQVLVLAGNHDFYEGGDNKLWKWFSDASEGTRIVPLLQAGTKRFACEDSEVYFYACPCPSKHGENHVIGWVADEHKPEGAIHIGIAHGNVEGLGLDAEQRYFNMAEKDLRAAGVHTWLLGHIHVPAPLPGTTGRPLFFMPGIHTPDSVKCTHSGHAWWIELEANGSCRHELLTTGAVRFVRVRRELHDTRSTEALSAECAALDAKNTILDLQLRGRLKEEQMSDLRQWLAQLKAEFLHVSHDVDIAEVLDAVAIAAKFPEGTLPHALLHGLLADEDYPGDAHLALDIIESLKRA
jgi:DNA repair exonuclease SbcCD nuclease subunit